MTSYRRARGTRRATDHRGGITLPVGKPTLLDACQHRKMKIAEQPANLLETRIEAEGVLDGMEVLVDMNCIAGMPGESQGAVTIRGNLAQILAVLGRVWPAAPTHTDAFSPGRQNWPSRRTDRKENLAAKETKENREARKVGE
jgi:hypothetical protein